MSNTNNTNNTLSALVDLLPTTAAGLSKELRARWKEYKVGKAPKFHALLKAYLNQELLSAHERASVNGAVIVHKEGFEGSDGEDVGSPSEYCGACGDCDVCHAYAESEGSDDSEEQEGDAQDSALEVDESDIEESDSVLEDSEGDEDDSEGDEDDSEGEELSDHEAYCMQQANCVDQFRIDHPGKKVPADHILFEMYPEIDHTTVIGA